MNRLVDFFDPRRSLASAVAWLASLLSLTIAVAMVWVSDVARDQLLASRDAALVHAAEALAAEVDAALGAIPGITRDASAAELSRIVSTARSGLPLDRNLRVLLLDDDQRVLLDSRAAASPGRCAVHADGGVIPVWDAGEAVLQRRPDGRRQVVVQARTDERPTLRRLGLQLMVAQLSEGTLWQGSEMQRRIAWLSLGVSALAALVGIVFARRLTRRLTRLTAAVRRIGTNPAERLTPPPGRDEVSELGRAFGALLHTLRQERDALDALTMELEQRVQARTREVERLAADSRYAAVVRERLRLARDLHDTLAQSMMATLAEIRTSGSCMSTIRPSWVPSSNGPSR
jgi:signal transduction histidine kinase